MKRTADLLVGDVIIRPSLGEIEHGVERVHLESRSMEVLLALAHKAPELVTKQDLIEEVWGKEWDSAEPLTHAIWELRRAFGDDAGNPKFIETVPKEGWRLISPVKKLQKCAKCKGSGKTFWWHCKACGGSGLETSEQPKQRPARMKARTRKALLLQGFIFGCACLLVSWSIGNITAEVRNMLNENPVIQEHFGKIDRIKWKGHDTRGQWLFRVSGARGSGEVQATIISDWGEVKAIGGGGTLKLPSGVRHNLLAESDSVLKDPAHLEGSTDWLRTAWNAIQPLQAVLPIILPVLIAFFLLAAIVEHFRQLD